MLTQENLNNQRAEQPLLPALLALITLLLVKQTDWIWSSLYFQRHTVGEISFATGLVTFFVIGCVSLLRRAFGNTKTRKLLNVCIFLLLAFFGFKYLTQLGWIPAQTTVLFKTFAVSLAFIAGLLSLKIRLETWKRLYLAFITGGLIFIFFPVLLANTNVPTIYWPSPNATAPNLKPSKLPAQNTIILLLDELSASAAGPVVDELKGLGLHVTSSSLDPAGKNTINVIPAIWAKSNFDQAVPCGPTQLCGTTKVLDFAKVKASSDNIDIVGFFHRYCSIEGLRSCSFSPMPAPLFGTNIACSYPVINKLSFLECNASASARKSWIAVHDSMQKTLLETPFWQKGGLLFAHLLSPHPLMGIPLKSLHEEYTDNIVNGAAFVKIVAQKAKFVFGNDFRIIIFSDHPLRADYWCADKIYSSLGCTPTSTQISSQVPLIIATPSNDKESKLSIHNNQNIFELLY